MILWDCMFDDSSGSAFVFNQKTVFSCSLMFNTKFILRKRGIFSQHLVGVKTNYGRSSSLVYPISGYKDEIGTAS